MRNRRLSDIAYEKLRDSIIELRLPPGFPIDEQDMSSRFELGLTPIRDALKRLNTEKLVAIYPRRGTFVTEINIADDLWLSEVRLELEGLAAALAAERATKEERIRLLKLAQNLQETTHSLDFISTDTTFHRELYRASHNHFLESTLNQYFNLALRISYFTIMNVPFEKLDKDEIIQSARAIFEKKSAEARTHMARHITHSSHVLHRIR